MNTRASLWSRGTVDVKLIREAVQTREFQNLPAAMRTPAEEAYKALLHTQDGQLCDIIIDKAALDAICAAGKSSGNEFLELYAELTVAAADIKTAVRHPVPARTGHSWNRRWHHAAALTLPVWLRQP